MVRQKESAQWTSIHKAFQLGIFRRGGRRRVVVDELDALSAGRDTVGRTWMPREGHASETQLNYSRGADHGNDRA